MSYIETKDGVQLHVKDVGKGKPVVLIHGWPLTGDMWEYQSLALLEAGYKVITYDRRGFGQSGHPFDGYDYDTFADDLAAVLDKLDIQSANLVGFSMGGGEVARYLSRHGTKRVAKAVLVSSVVPYLLKDASNPDGVDQSVFDDIKKQIRKDRFAFLQPSARCSTASAWSAVPSVMQCLIGHSYLQSWRARRLQSIASMRSARPIFARTWRRSRSRPLSSMGRPTRRCRSIRRAEPPPRESQARS